MAQRYTVQEKEDISSLKITGHLLERFMIRSGLTNILEATQQLQHLLKNARRFERRQNSIVYLSDGWQIVTQKPNRKGNNRCILTIYPHCQSFWQSKRPQ